MLSIRDGAAMQCALSGPLDPELKAILLARLELLAEFADWDLGDLAHFHVVECGDNIEVIEKELGFSPLVNFVDGARFGDQAFTPSFEWIIPHGIWFEMVFALSDSGFAIVLIVQNCRGVEPTLLALCNAYY
jgi:hypothetical protein